MCLRHRAAAPRSMIALERSRVRLGRERRQSGPVPQPAAVVTGPPVSGFGPGTAFSERCPVRPHVVREVLVGDGRRRERVVLVVEIADRPSAPPSRRSVPRRYCSRWALSVSEPPPLPKMPPISPAIATTSAARPRLRHATVRAAGGVVDRQQRRVGPRRGDVGVHAVDVGRRSSTWPAPPARRTRCGQRGRPARCACACVYGASSSWSWSICSNSQDAPRKLRERALAVVAQHVHQEQPVLGLRVAGAERRALRRCRRRCAGRRGCRGRS